VATTGGRAPAPARPGRATDGRGPRPGTARTSAGTVSSVTTARLMTALHEMTVPHAMTVRTAPRARKRVGGRKRAAGPRRAGILPGQPGVPDIPRAEASPVSAGAQGRVDISDICSQAAGLRGGFTFSVTRTPTRSVGCGRLAVAVGGLCDRNSLPDSTKSQRS
jgi:hypothetical protein